MKPITLAPWQVQAALDGRLRQLRMPLNKQPDTQPIMQMWENRMSVTWVSEPENGAIMGDINNTRSRFSVFEKLWVKERRGMKQEESRLVLEVKDVRVERIRSATLRDMLDCFPFDNEEFNRLTGGRLGNLCPANLACCFKDKFYYDSSGSLLWQKNPWVWVYDVKVKETKND